MPLTPLAGTLHTLRVESRCLAGNLLGDPSEREVHVYAPPGHGDAGKRFPAIMLLPGFGSTARSLLPKDFFKDSVVERFDRLLRGGQTQPAILVMPEAGTRFGGSQFVDSPVTGRHQAFLAEEVFAAVDARFATRPEAAERAVAGVSSGGFGALRLAIDRPGTVSVVASIAGDAAFELSLRPMTTAVAAHVLAAGGAASFLRKVETSGPPAGAFDALFFLASAQAYAPDEAAPFPHCRLPFALETGAFNDAVWQRYLAHDPVHRVNNATEALAELRAVLLDVGTGDEYGLQFAARSLHKALVGLGVPCHLEEFEGGHRGASHRYETLLPRIIDALGHG